MFAPSSNYQSKKRRPRLHNTTTTTTIKPCRYRINMTKDDSVMPKYFNIFLFMISWISLFFLDVLRYPATRFLILITIEEDHVCLGILYIYQNVSQGNFRRNHRFKQNMFNIYRKSDPQWEVFEEFIQEKITFAQVRRFVEHGQVIGMLILSV